MVWEDQKGEGAMNKVVGCNPCSVDLQSPQSRAVRSIPAFLLSCLKQFFYPQCFFESCNHQFRKKLDCWPLSNILNESPNDKSNIIPRLTLRLCHDLCPSFKSVWIGSVATFQLFFGIFTLWYLPWGNDSLPIWQSGASFSPDGLVVQNPRVERAWFRRGCVARTKSWMSHLHHLRRCNNLQRGGVLCDGRWPVIFWDEKNGHVFFSVRKYRGCDWGRDFVEFFGFRNLLSKSFGAKKMDWRLKIINFNAEL